MALLAQHVKDSIRLVREELDGLGKLADQVRRGKKPVTSKSFALVVESRIFTIKKQLKALENILI